MTKIKYNLRHVIVTTVKICLLMKLVVVESELNILSYTRQNPDSKVHGANMGPIWGRQDPGGPSVGPMNFAIWDAI